MTTKSLPRVAVIVAAYNEEKVIAETLSVVPKQLPGLADLDVVLVDDGSRDATLENARACGVITLHHSINRGQGAALETGFEYARRHHYDAVVTYDADGQHNPDEIKDLLKPVLSGEYDVALGSRFIGETQGMSSSRKLIIRGGILFTRLISRIRVSDTHNGFRALSSAALQQVRLREDRMEHASEILDIIARKNLRFTEVPVTITYTDYSMQKGQRNSNALKIALNMLMYKLTTSKR
jgi:glycosyltransferase involved in cell wall biosynthesis